MLRFCMLCLLGRKSANSICVVAMGAIRFSVCVTSVAHTFLYFKEDVCMFNNIGRKIKILAEIITIIGIILSCILGISLFGLLGETELWFLGIITIAVGILFSWLTTLLLYGFGQLVENTSMLVKLQSKTIDSRKETENIGECIITDSASSVFSAPSNHITPTIKDKNVIERWKRDGLISEEEYNDLIKKSEE